MPSQGPPLPVWAGKTCPTMCAAQATQRDGYYQPLEKAEIVRAGSDVTILCYSRMRYVVMQGVATVEKEGYNPEVSLVCFFGAGCMSAVRNEPLWRRATTPRCASWVFLGIDACQR